MENKVVKSPIYFIDYNSIKDTLMWLNNEYVLKFCVTLQKADSSGNTKSFHSEFSYTDKSTNTERISINRSYSFYYLISQYNKNSYNKSVVLRPGDVELLRMFIPNNIYPWYIGNEKKRAFVNNDGVLLAKTDYKAQFPLSDRSFIEFRPTVIEYQNTREQKEGIRISINSNTNYFDISVDKFLEFCNYILRTDMLNAAMSMLNYVKTKPYGINLNSSSQNQSSSYNYNYSGKSKGFF